MPVQLLINDGHGGWMTIDQAGAYVPPPPTDPLPTLDPNALLATGNWVEFESLMQAGEEPTVTTDAQGGTFRAFAPDVFTTIADRCPTGKGLIFGYGTYEINTPGWTHGDNSAWQIPKTCIGVVGQTPPGTSWGDIEPTTLRTTLRIKPNTGSTSKNWLGAAIKFGYSGSVRADFANLHFEGTDQGLQTTAAKTIDPGPGNDGTSPRLFTNFFGYNQADGCTMRDCLSTGWYGNNGAPPGEVFGVEWYGSTGGKLHRVCVDGRRAAGGPIYGSAGITFGSSLDCEATDCYAHHCQQAGFVMFQVARCKTYNLVLGDPNDKTTVHVTFNNRKGDWLNHERSTASVHYKTTFNSVYIGGTGVHATNSNDHYTITRSGESIVLDNGWIGVVDPVSWSNLGFSGALMAQTWQASDTGGAYGNGNTMKSSNPPRFVIDDGRSPIPAMKWSFDVYWYDVPVLAALP